MIGAFFTVVFFSRKISGLNLAGFQEKLADRIAADMRLVAYVLDQFEARDARARALREAAESREKDETIKKQRAALASVLKIRDSLGEDQKKFVDQSLARAGVGASSEDYIVWSSRDCDELYDTIGLIADGDLARILRPYESWDGRVTKGLAQKAREPSRPSRP